MSSKINQHFLPPRELLVSWLARLYRHGLTTTTGGNISILDDENTMYITPSGGDKAIVPPENVAVRKKGEKQFQGPLAPSMEWPLHTAAYKARPEDCRAVLHAHSISLVAFSMTQCLDIQNSQHFKEKGKKRKHDEKDDCIIIDPRVPDTRCLLSAWESCGQVALVSYCLPGSMKLAEECEKAFETGATCVILQNHGVVTIGKTLHEAYDRFVSLEYLAKSIIHSTTLENIPKPLPLSILQHPCNNNSKKSSILGEEHFLPGAIDLCPSSVTCYQRGRIITSKEKEVRKSLCNFVHRAYRQNLITSSSGSFSCRLEHEYISSIDNTGRLSFLVTPTNVDRNAIQPSDVCFISNEIECSHHNAANSDDKKKILHHHPSYHPQSFEYVSPSRAAAIHSTIYKSHPEISCIMVVTPTYVTSYCITGCNFNSAGIPESHIVLHNVQTLPFESLLKHEGIEIAAAFDPKKGKNTVFVQGYGMFTIGNCLPKTFVQLEVCESMCGVSLTAKRRGPIEMLSVDQVCEIDSVFKVH
jgi:L-fuculose-phosphate aldolase